MGTWRGQGRLLAAVVVLVGVLAITRPAEAEASAPAPAPDIAAVARAARRSVGEVRRILSDPSAKVGAGDRIYFDEARPDEADRQRAAEPVSLRREVDPAQTFLLHSRPGSPRVIHLDFDGHTITNTAWNDAGGLSTITAPAFSLDDASPFSAAEHEAIQSIWQRVAEDFSPFDVDVTTQDPGEAAITRTGPADLRFGTRALVTNWNVTGDPCGCAGRAYFGVFDEPTDHARFQPALIFSGELGGKTKFVADAVSHEVGHNLNLRHDGDATSDYYWGHGAWVPIMGYGWYPVSQWSKGEYAGATNTEDDLQVMQDSGLSLFPDDHGGTAATATLLGPGPTTGAAGLIGTDEDVDVFRVQVPVGTASFTVSPAPDSPNLDLRLELRSAAGDVLAESNPPVAAVQFDLASGLDATITVPVTVAGPHYLHVSGVGTGDPTTGYSGYGSIGLYALKARLRVPAVSLVSSRNPSTIRDPVTYTATLSVPPPGSGTPTGTVTFNDGTTPLCRDVPMSLGQARCTATLVAGDRPITAVYNGDATFSAATSPVVTQVVDGDPVTVTLTTTPNPSSVGALVTLRATVAPGGAGTPTGTIAFTKGDQLLCNWAPLEDGEASCQWQGWRGEHPLTATYNGDDRFDRTTSPVHTHVTTGTATSLELTSRSNPSVTKEAVDLVATVTAASPPVGNSVSGKVTFKQGDTVLCTSPVYGYEDGNRAFCRSSFDIGTYAITAAYSGDAERLPSASAVLTQTVTQGQALVELTSSSNPSSAAQTVWIRARVRNQPPAQSWTTGTVTFTSNGATLCSAVPISSGEAVCIRSFAKGSYAIVASYSGDASFVPASAEIVGPPAPSVTLTSSSNPSLRGAPVTLTATVSAAASGTGTPTGTVSFLDSETVLCSAAPISGFVARCTTSFGAGQRPLRAVYGGDATFASGSSAILTQKVTGDTATVALDALPTGSVSGQSITLRAAVAAAAPGLPTPTGTITLRDGTEPLCTGVPLVDGSGSCAAALRAGAHSITADYTGDDRFNAATSTATGHAVARAAATVAVGSPTNPSQQFQPAVFSATVSVTAPGAAVATGTVTFTSGDTVLCAAVGVVEAKASCNASLTGGTHRVTATYSGDAEVEGATSPVHEQFVQLMGDVLTAVTPKRLLDTRSGVGGAGGPIGPGATRSLAVRGGPTGIPDDATAVVLNVTATSPSTLSFLTVHPSATARPGTSNLTFAAGQTIANLVTVSIGTDGAVAFFNAHGSMHAIADVVGYYRRTGGSTSTSVPAKRLLDTRVGTGGPAAPVGAGVTRELTVRGGATGIPETATAVLVNMTVTAPTATGYLTVHPAGVARPTASNLNFVTGQTVANLTLVGIGAGGRISIFNAAGSAHVLADVVGYYAPAGGGSFHALPPQRILDTRGHPAGPLGPGHRRDVPVMDAVPLPPMATVLLNVTAVGPTASGFMTVNPTAWGLPSTSNLNFSRGQVISNLAVADVDFTNRTAALYNSDGFTHVVVDIVGYSTPY